MIATSKEFMISRLRNDTAKPIQYFEEYDWRRLDHSDKTFWQQGWQQLSKIHNEVIEIIQQQRMIFFLKKCMKEIMISENY